MSESFRALCSDLYVNQKLTVKLDLPKSRETVLEMFERVRRQFPEMNSFRKYREELALESPQSETPHRWLAMRSNSLRSGTVNPQTMDEAYALHNAILKIAPSYLSVSALDVESVELLYGFDLMAPGNHDAIVFDALLAGSPLGSLLAMPGVTAVDCQPVIGIQLGNADGIEAHFEVKTRGGRSREGEPFEPISIYLILRKSGPVNAVEDLPGILSTLSQHGEELVERRLLPGLLMPIRDAIASQS
jgi:hypothetical protein